MRRPFIRCLALAFLLALLQLDAGAQAPSAQPADGKAQPPARSQANVGHPLPKICAACIRAHMEFLASDAIQGRGSGTHDELIAATYVASQLRQYGIEPAGDEGGYIQRAATMRQALSAPPELTITQPDAALAKQLNWIHGKEMLVLNLSQPELAAPPEKGYTWNGVGVLRGRDPRKNAIVLSAHLDHLGIGAPVNGDRIYNGADDDASGTTAVLEMARVLGSGTRPLRTVIFALFGSEEAGGLGSTYFREHPPVPLKEIAADLEFEMIGRPDPKVPDDSLWLTGWERSNLA